MAERRMFSSKIVCSDAFTEMPFSAQALYLQLNMEADDDGFLNSPKRVMRMLNASEDDLNLLFEKRFILGFKNGVIAIKHWRMNNQIRKDRYTPTQYQDEYALLDIKTDGAYTEKDKTEAVDTLATTWQPDGNQMATQYRLGKVSIGKVSIEEDIKGDSSESEAPVLIDSKQITNCLREQETQTTNCRQIVDLYNSICKSLPTVRSLSDARKKAIKARLNTYTLDDFKTVFENAEASSFLKGGNDRNWQANFDWLISDKNMAKVLEGNYADKPSRYGRKEAVPGWMKKRELDEDEIAAVQRMMQEDNAVTVGNNAELAERAERLKHSLQGC